MNPILLKPKGNGMQIVLDGRPYQDIDRHSHVDREELLAHIRDAYLRLCRDFDAIVIEGSGSPAEVNLRDKDVANMATARMLRAPVVLIGDIDKGGVFAGLYGTYELLEERDRGLVKGFLINKFRGEEGILQSGILRLEREMRCHCLGVLPHHRFQAPAEDSMELGLHATGMGGNGDVREMWKKGLEDLARVTIPRLDMARVERIMQDGA
jgi:adenosylcobyric acid synthase